MFSTTARICRASESEVSPGFRFRRISPGTRNVSNSRFSSTKSSDAMAFRSPRYRGPGAENPSDSIGIENAGGNEGVVGYPPGNWRSFTPLVLLGSDPLVPGGQAAEKKRRRPANK